MPCLNCESSKMIHAHLSPKVFCKQIQVVGRSHAARVNQSGKFSISQSGVWDEQILCDPCDKMLGRHEEYANKVFETIRLQGSGKLMQPKPVEGVEIDTILRFIAGILFKYGATQHPLDHIELGCYQEVCRHIAFSTEPITKDFDAFMFRPVRYIDDDGVFAYRAPLPDRKHGVNLYRFMLGGMIIFAKLDKRPIVDKAVAPYTLNGASCLYYVPVPAQAFEEYQLPRAIIAEHERLSSYLDKTREGH